MHRFFIRITKTLIRLRGWAGWFDSSLGAHVKRYVFSRCGSNDQGPVVQSIVSIMSSLVVKMLTFVGSTVSNSQVFLLKKCE